MLNSRLYLFNLFYIQGFEARQKVARLIKDVPKHNRERSKVLQGVVEKPEEEFEKAIAKDYEDIIPGEKDFLAGDYTIKPNEHKPATCIN